MIKQCVTFRFTSLRTLKDDYDKKSKMLSFLPLTNNLVTVRLNF